WSHFPACEQPERPHSDTPGRASRTGRGWRPDRQYDCLGMDLCRWRAGADRDVLAGTALAAVAAGPDQRRGRRRRAAADILRTARQSDRPVAYRAVAWRDVELIFKRRGRAGQPSMTTSVTINRLASGVPGLDEVLGGGLPEYSFNLVAGQPGCGKTTLAHQIMFALATPERPALYFTVLGEPALKMLRYQQQFEFFRNDAINQEVHF